MNILFDRSVVPTYNRLSCLPLGQVTARGWLRDQLLLSKEGLGGHLDELEPDMIATPFINYSAFKKLPHHTEVDDPTFAAGWSSEISGTYWTGLVQLAFTLGDRELIEKASKWIEGVLMHQEPDGYLGGYPENTDRSADYNAWSAAWCYRSMLSYYEATADERVLDAVHRGLLWFCEHWKNHKTDYVGSIIIEAMTVVYAYTGDRRLIDFSEDWLNWLEKNSNQLNKVSDLLSDELPYAGMHVVAYGEDVKNPAILYCATNEKKLLDAGVNGMKKALNKIIQATGAPSSCNEFLSPKGASNETEYCNFATFNHSYMWLALATGESFWGDEMERNFFNGAQGGRRNDEKSIAYFTAPNQIKATRDSSRYGDVADKGAYAPCFYVACCPTKSVCNAPEFLRMMCMTDRENAVCLMCYGPAEIRSEKLDFTIDTLYPFRERISIKINRAENAVLKIRVPGWCKAPSVTVCGKAAKLTREQSGLYLINTPFNTGDTAELYFPMEVTLGRVDDSECSAKFPLCIKRGPLVYAIPVPEKWSTYPGMRITPETDTWDWYEAVPDTEKISGTPPWALAAAKGLTPEQITVTEHCSDGYVWENPPVTLNVPLLPIADTYTCWAFRNYEVWNTVPLKGFKPVNTELIPHGCRNLRITYIPVAQQE